MTKQTQALKNLDLIDALGKFIEKKGNQYDFLEEISNVVVFSATDKKLKSANSKLFNSLINKGESVIKAVQEDEAANSWTFEPHFAQ